MLPSIYLNHDTDQEVAHIEALRLIQQTIQKELLFPSGGEQQAESCRLFLGDGR